MLRSLVALALVICSELLALSHVEAQCIPEFKPYNAVWGNTSLGNWLGADAAYSVSLGKGRTLWVFGDTFLSFNSSSSSRIRASIVANTVAVSTCTGPGNTFSVHHQWKFDGSSSSLPLRFAPIFTPKDTQYVYWPAQPWMQGEKLFVPLLLVKRVTGGLGFEIHGTHLAHVSNPESPPSAWTIHYHDLFRELNVNGGQGVVAAAGYVFFLNGLPNGTSLSRIPQAAFEVDPRKAIDQMEFWSQEKRWERGHNSARAKNLGFKAGSGLTLHRVSRTSETSEWMAVFADFSTPYVAEGISVSFSSRLIGDWSTPQRIFKFPFPSASKSDAHCYAAYGHRSFSANWPAQIGLTYNCNRDREKIITDMSIYFPQFIERSIPSIVTSNSEKSPQIP